MLVCWLPLNGDLKNQGLSDVTISGGNSYINNGKIGKAYNASNEIVITIPSLKNSKVWSYCFWGYVNSASVTTNWTQIARINDGSSNLRVEVCPKSFGNGIYCYSTHNNTGNVITNGDIPSPSGGYYDQWAHFCLISDGTTISKYMNGKLVGTNTYNGTGAINGTFVLANSHITYKNDVRIYDHCLSAKEVKEISKGLVLHYKLDNNGMGNENLLNGDVHLASAWVQDKYTVSNYRDDNYTGIKIYSPLGGNRTYNMVQNAWTVKGKYRVSFMAKSDTNGTIIDMSRSIADFSERITLTTDWKYYTATINTTEVSDGGTLSIRILQEERNAYIANLKLERGDKVTNYCPPKNSTLYSQLGLNNNIEYDCSGYKNDGTKVGTIGTDSTSPRYDVANKFEKLGHIKNSNFNINTQQCTISLWVNQKNATTQHFLLGTFTSWTGNGIGFYRDTNQQGFYCIFKSDAESSYGSIGTGIIPLDEWHLITYVYNGTQILSYIDGEYKNTLPYGKNGNIVNPLFMIGNSMFSNTPSSENEEASISDVRFYSTALSADDIAELYQTSASIDKNGNLYAYSFEEA